ncbi:melatonin receptor type 1A-A-like [Branchiostoma floridae x Branchiostoma belcheri]
MNGTEQIPEHGNGTVMAEPAAVMVLQQPWEKWFAGAMYGVLALAGIVGNVMVLLAIVMDRRLRTTNNLFIFNLCVSDLLVAACYDPMSAVSVIKARWVSGSVMCSVAAAINVVSLMESTMAVGLIALNCNCRVTKPPGVYRENYRFKRCLAMVAASWLLAVAIAVPPFVGFGQLGYDQYLGACDYNFHSHLTFYYYLTFPVFTVMATNVVVTVCYVNIFISIKRSADKTRGDEAMQVTIHRTKHMFVIFCVFVVTTLPEIVMIILDVLVKPMPPELNLFAHILLLSNSSINPIIYTIRQREFRVAYRAFLTCTSIRAVKEQCTASQFEMNPDRKYISEADKLCIAISTSKIEDDNDNLASIEGDDISTPV